MVNYYLLVPREILLTVTSTSFFENNDFAEDGALVLSGLITRRKGRSTTKLVLAELTGEDIVKWYNIKGRKSKKVKRSEI